MNRKIFPSFNVQATCDEDFKFTSIDVGWPGSVHDSRILKNSTIFRHLSQNSNGCLLADAGYGITPFIITPFGNPISEEEKCFNKYHAKNRVVIEQCFGQLKRRFPILRYGIRLKFENIPLCISACCILHNIARHLNEFDFADDEYEEADMGQNCDIVNGQKNLALQLRGEHRRRELASIVYNRYN